MIDFMFNGCLFGIYINPPSLLVASIKDQTNIWYPKFNKKIKSKLFLR
jgi:hypothetical protein